MWAIIIQLADRWNMPPWQIEDEMTAEWWHRVSTYERIKQEVVEKNSGKKHS